MQAIYRQDEQAKLPPQRSQTPLEAISWSDDVGAKLIHNRNSDLFYLLIKYMQGADN